MRDLIRQAYDIYRDRGPLEVVKGLSRYANKQYYSRRYGRPYNSRGTDVLDEDWDNLVILDACRFDYFKRYSDFGGRLESRVSRGSTTKQFVRGNFADTQALDTVYLTDNPWYGKLRTAINSELYAYSFCERDAFDGIASHPSTVTDAAIEFNGEHEHKRLVVHYLQPHAPYFNTEGEEVCRWPADPGRETVRSAYVDNLKLVLGEVERLLADLTGKTVITADHGELLGERLPPIPLRQYQHPGRIYVEELVKVPWLVLADDNRKSVETERRPEHTEATPTDEINEQLAGLGYL